MNVQMQAIVKVFVQTKYHDEVSLRCSKTILNGLDVDDINILHLHTRCFSDRSETLR